MLVHVVLFRPKAGVSEPDRQAMVDALAIATSEIPSVRRVQIGSRIMHGAAYELLVTQDFPYAAVIGFDDLAGLQAYLQHPKHRRVGELFAQLQEAALVYDYDVEERS